MKNKKTCVWHCGGCQSHFHSIAAFDSHRIGMVCSLENVNKNGQPLLQVYTETGSCDLMKGCRVEGKRDHWVEPVTIYQRYGHEYTGVRE